MYICTYLCLYMHEQVHAYIHAHAHMYVYIYICVCVYVYIYIHINICQPAGAQMLGLPDWCVLLSNFRSLELADSFSAVSSLSLLDANTISDCYVLFLYGVFGCLREHSSALLVY